MQLLHERLIFDICTKRIKINAILATRNTNDMTNTPKQRGGARPGAGRPKGEPTVNRTFRIPAAHAAQATQEIRKMLKAYRDRCKK